MYQHILLAVALQRWDEFSPHALAARQVAVALARGAGAPLTVLSVYDYEDETPEALSLAPEALGLSVEDRARARDAQIQRTDARMAAKLQAFLAGVPAGEIPVTPLLKVGHPRQVIVATAEALGVDLLVIGAHSKRSFLDVLLGGTAAAVSRQAPCAVVLVQPGEQRPLAQTGEAGQTLQEAPGPGGSA
jgi:nucleotide-binding universal stress UspA family protein